MSPLDGHRLRVVLVGAGTIADAVHVPAIRALSDDLELVSVVEPLAQRRDEFAGRWGIPHADATLDEALARHPDLVILCTPPSVHRVQVDVSLRAGAWVWCEKPPALSLADFDAMVARERTDGPFASVVFQQRYGSGAAHAAELLRSGAIGRPLAAHCQTTWYRDAAYFSDPWRGSFDGDGGPMLALGIHQLDLLLHLVGEWAETSARVARMDRDIETGDTAAAWVRFESGLLATVLTSAVSPHQESRIRVDAQQATLELAHLHRQGNDAWSLTAPPGVEADPSWTNRLPDEPASHESQLRELITDIRANRRPTASGPSARAGLELVTAMYKSAITGRVVARGEIVEGDPFYGSLQGGGPVPWSSR